jgi:hypothetical protein
MPDDHHTTTDDLPHGTFAEGQADPTHYPDDTRNGRFSDGEAGPVADEEAGRFSEGVEELGDADPEKHVGGTFAETER